MTTGGTPTEVTVAHFIMRKMVASKVIIFDGRKTTLLVVVVFSVMFDVAKKQRELIKSELNNSLAKSKQTLRKKEKKKSGFVFFKAGMKSINMYVCVCVCVCG